MTVAELKEKLEDKKDDAVVTVCIDDGQVYFWENASDVWYTDGGSNLIIGALQGR